VKRKSRFIGNQKKKLITKARKDENTKKIKDKFRAFYISCFRDEKIFSLNPKN